MAVSAPLAGDPAMLDLEGPWNSFEDFLAAERARARLRSQALGEHTAAAGKRAAGGRKKKGRAPKALPPVQPRQTASVAVSSGIVFAADGALAMHGGTFALTAMGKPMESGFTEYERGPARSQSSLELPRRASGSLSAKPTEQPLTPPSGCRGTGQVDMLTCPQLCDVSTQCRPMELEQDSVDRILRRYSFSLEWDYGSLGPGLVGSFRDAETRHSAGIDREEAAADGGDKPRVDESLATSGEQAKGDLPQKQLKRASLAALEDPGAHEAGRQSAHPASNTEDNECPNVENDQYAGRRPHTSQATRVSDGSRSSSKDALADAVVGRLRGRRAPSRSRSADGGVSAESSFATLFSTELQRSRSPGPRAMNTVTPQVAMRFYDVKLTEKETDMPIDYTVDYRRYAYTDFRIPGRGEGCSTVDPELIADWIDRAVPRNQDDAHPLFVLSRDLLRKFHQKEIRYAVRKEQDMLAEIQQLHAALMGHQASRDALERQRALELARFEHEKSELQQQIADMQLDMDWLHSELVRYKELEEHMHMEMNEALKLMEQLSLETKSLNLQLKPLNVVLKLKNMENWDLKEKLKKLLQAKDDEQSARVEALHLQMQDLLKKLAEAQGERDQERRRADEAEQVIRDLKAKSALEWVAEWDHEIQTGVFKHFFETQLVRKPGKDDAHVIQERPIEEINAQQVLEQPLRANAQAKADAKGKARVRAPERAWAGVAAIAGAGAAVARAGAPGGAGASGTSAEAAAEAAKAGAVVIASLFEKDDDEEDDYERYRVAECMTWEMFDSLPGAKKFEFTKKHIASLKFVVEERMAKQDDGWTWGHWLDILGSLLGVPASEIFHFVFDLVRGDKWTWGVLLLGHRGAAGVRWEGVGWELVRGALRGAKIELDSLTALSTLCGVDELTLMAKIVGLDPKYIPMIKEHWDLFLKWFARFGAMADGLDAAELERQKIREKVKKYALFDMERMDGEPYSLEETLQYIGQLIDFKFKSDYINETEQRPRLNMVRVIRNYMMQKHEKKRVAEEQIKRFCASILKWSEINLRVKLFGMCAGMVEILTCWTERGTCIWMVWLHELKKLSSPGMEAQPRDTWGESFQIFAPWLGSADKVVELEHALAAAKAALDSDFSFGDMPAISSRLSESVVNVPGMSAGLSIDKAMDIFMQLWFRDFQDAKKALVQVFEHFDIDGDESLDMQEFLDLLRHTPLKIRQHDAMSMFNEVCFIVVNNAHPIMAEELDSLAGPDGTMDEDEFAEILTFYKFNSRGVLNINLEKAAASKDAQIAMRESVKQKPT